MPGMALIPVEDRAELLSDNAAGYHSKKFIACLRLVGTRHIVASPFPPDRLLEPNPDSRRAYWGLIPPQTDQCCPVT